MLQSNKKPKRPKPKSYQDILHQTYEKETNHYEKLNLKSYLLPKYKKDV